MFEIIILKSLVCRSDATVYSKCFPMTMYFEYGHSSGSPKGMGDAMKLKISPVQLCGTGTLNVQNNSISSNLALFRMAWVHLTSQKHTFEKWSNKWKLQRHMLYKWHTVHTHKYRAAHSLSHTNTKTYLYTYIYT